MKVCWWQIINWLCSAALQNLVANLLCVMIPEPETRMSQSQRMLARVPGIPDHEKDTNIIQTKQMLSVHNCE